MPSFESVSDADRAKTEFAAAVRTGIDALMARCGYSRERAVGALLKKISRGSDSSSSSSIIKLKDEEIFDTMRRHGLGIDEATRVLVVSRAVQREMAVNNSNEKDKKVTHAEAIHRLISKISLFESADDDDDGESGNDINVLPLNIPKVVNPFSSSLSTGTINLSSSAVATRSTANTTTTTSTMSHNKKNTRKKVMNPSPRKQLKVNYARVSSSSSSRSKNTPAANGNNIHIGRKRSIEDIDSSTSAEMDAKITTNPAAVVGGGGVSVEGGSKIQSSRTTRASKRLHRSVADTVVDVNATVVASNAGKASKQKR